MKRKKTLTLTEIYILAMQISLFLPCLYILYAAGSFSLIMKKGILAILFDFGIAAMPRLSALGASWLYRLTLNEVIVCYALLFTALGFGLIAGHFYEKDEASAKKLRTVCAAGIAIDLVIRLLPLGFNQPFGLTYQIIGYIIRAACLTMIIIDIRKK